MHVPLAVIGLGVGRTGTYSLKLALEELGFGPCHHMEEVDVRSPVEIARWKAAAAGDVDWEEAYSGYRAAVDWPTAAFCSELVGAYPDARFILSVRARDKWYESFSKTIYPLLTSPDQTGEELAPFVDMVAAVTAKSGFTIPSSREQALLAFDRHVAFVKSTVPGNRLLTYDVKEGWAPLCRFLGVATPDRPFPKTNTTQDFWKSAEHDIART